MCISVYFGSKKRTIPSVPVRMLNCTVKNTSGNEEHLGLLTTCFSEHIPSVIQRTFREFEQPTAHLKYTEKVFPAWHCLPTLFRRKPVSGKLTNHRPKSFSHLWFWMWNSINLRVEITWEIINVNTHKKTTLLFNKLYHGRLTFAITCSR